MTVGTLLAMSSGATVRYVTSTGQGDGSSWSNASSDIQAMIDASSAGDEIWVASGTYKPTKLIKSTKKTSKAFILKDGVSLYGGFVGNEIAKDSRAKGAKPYEMVNATVLDADDDVPDVWNRQIDEGSTYRWSWELENNVVKGTRNNSTHVLYCEASFTTPTVIDGLTMRGANANVYQAKASGGAVYALGSVTLSNCRMIENSSYFTAEATDCNSYGGAVYLDGGRMEGCLISKTFCHSSYGNALGGGVYARNAVITDCDFEDCVGLDQGGAVYMVNGSLANCTFNRCYSAAGGAIYNQGGTVTDIDVFDCRGLNGGGVYNAGSLRNALIRNCYADAPEYGDNGGKGGGLYNVSGDAVNCAVFNCTSFTGGGVFLNNGRLINATAVNNTIREGGADTNVHGNASDIYNSIVDAGTNLDNFVQAPSFAGRAAGEAQSVLIAAADMSLAPGSEFIDAGTPLEGFTSGTDLAGNPRLCGQAIDRGAYESQGAAEVPTITLTFAPGTQAARIGVGGASGYEFKIDWGNGQPETYSQQAYHSHLLTGNTVRIYGDDIIVLQAPSQDIIAADISRASKLIRVMLGTNGLASLTLGNHPSLTGLYAEGNSLKSIDVSGCPALTVLDVHENEIEGTIDCSAMMKLSKVDIADNKVSSIILPKSSTVYDIDVDNNQLTRLDVTGLSGLDELNASGNQLTSIDLSGLTAVSTIRLGENNLSSIDISSCRNLTSIQVADNKISSIDLTQNAKLEGIYLQDNMIGTINLSGNPQARYINISNNQLSEIDVTQQPLLSLLFLNGNRLSTIDLSKNTSISSLDLSSNSLTAVDVSKATYLSQLHLENNALTAIDLSANKYLYGLFIGNNALSSLDISANTYLQRLEAPANILTSIDIAANTGLQSLMLQSNKFNAEAINSMISALPDVTSVNVTPDTDFLRKLNISNMPGTPDANVSVAETKGWYVTADYDRPQETTLTSLNIQINRLDNSTIETSDAEIEWANEQQTSFRIVNFMGSGSNVTGTIDAAGNVKIAPQVCGGDPSGNYYMIVNEDNTGGNPMQIYNTYVGGQFDGQHLTLDPWNLIIVPYTFAENLGTAYSSCLTSEFVMGNGTMTYSNDTRSTVTKNIYAVVNNATLDVYNWAGCAMTTMSRSDGQWHVNASTQACVIDKTAYFLTATDGNELVSASVPDARNIHFGAWKLSSNTDKILSNGTNAVITVNFDLPVVTGVDGIEADEAVSETYINTAGIRSDKPFNGINFVEKTFADGRRTVTKTLIRR